MFRVVICILLLFIYMLTVVDQLPRLGKRELICLLLFSCHYVVSVWRGFLFLWVLGMGYVILLWHSLSLPYNYFAEEYYSVINNDNEYLKGLVHRQLVCSFNIKNSFFFIMSNILEKYGLPSLSQLVCSAHILGKKSNGSPAINFSNSKTAGRIFIIYTSF